MTIDGVIRRERKERGQGCDSRDFFIDSSVFVERIIARYVA